MILQKLSWKIDIHYNRILYYIFNDNIFTRGWYTAYEES